MTPWKIDVPFPEVPAVVKRYGPYGAAIYSYVIRSIKQQGGGGCIDNQYDIANHTGMTRKTTGKYLRLLVDDGYLKEYRAYRNEPAEYRVTDKIPEVIQWLSET